MASVPSAQQAAIRRSDEMLQRMDPESRTAALVAFVRRAAAVTYRGRYGVEADIPGSSDPASGVIDLPALRAALREAGDALAWQACTVLRQSGEPVDNAVTLVEAAAGWNRATVEKGLRFHKQIAVKAYGLLPLTRGADEALERYLLFQAEAKEAQTFDLPRRRPYEAVVQAGLANLAQVAGYADASRLEWAMEARIADDIPAGRRWPVGDYTVELIVEGAAARIGVERAGKRLKSPPADVRASEAYQGAKLAVARLRGQASRMRSGLLEGLIASGEALSLDELRRLLRLPAARDMFARLLWRDESGVVGLFDAEAFALRDLDWELHPVESPLTLVHSYHLFNAGTLSEWQRAVVHAHVVQPIKQVFRELYVLTPAERDSADESNRFAGHRVDAAIAKRLLAVRRWQLQQDDRVLMPSKLRAGVRAVFDFGDSLTVYASGIPAITGRIYFETATGRRLALDAIPPVFFSEVMRDADLIAAVAQRDGDVAVSPETYSQRGQLVRALLDDLGLPGVEVEGHFAHVQGKLARYRVHLGSAAIHIEPGNYLCIVPNSAANRREPLYLPFADADDPKFSEVVSKILLLLSDDRIKDESILRQIRRLGAG